jgi:sugar lactone lactonase YvrE
MKSINSPMGFALGLVFTIFCCLPVSAQIATDYALGFNGSQTVNIPLQAAQNAYPLTVMCWFMEPTNSPGNGALVGKYGSGTLNGWQLASSGGQLYAWYWRNLNNNVSFVGTGAVNDGLWHHAAFVVNSTGGILYLDGIPIQTNAWTGTPGPCTTAEPIYLGIYQGDSLYTGDLDEVSVWNVALTQSQIQTYMHQPLQGTETGLLNYYRMNEGSGTVIHDSTANAATGVFSPNPPTWIISGAQMQTPPQVATLPATVNVISATLSGTVNPGGLNTGYWFNWGLTTSYGNVTATSTLAATYFAIYTNSITLSNLAAGTYHFQMVATNASGTNYGLDQSFTINRAYLLGTTNLLVAGVGGNNSVILVVTPVTVPWTVSANTNWLHTTAGYQSGTGSTNIIFSVDSNPGGARTGSFTIGDQTLTITQAPSNYVVALPFASTIVSGLNSPRGMALDGAGNIYFISYPKIVEWNKTNNTLTTLTQVSGGANPSGVAVDKNGNVYFSDGALNTVKEWNAATSNVTTLVSSGLNRPGGIAVDSAGNVYIADAFNNALKEWVAASGTVVTVVPVTDPPGVALDVAGNVYIAGGNGTLLEWQPATSNLVTLATQSQGVNGAGQLSVDGSGNVFEVDINDGVIQEWLAAYPNGRLPLASAYGQGGVAVDSSENLFLTYFRDGTVKELQRAFVDPTVKSEPFSAGNDSLPPVFPDTTILTGTFAPYTDQPWVTITGLTNGVVSFSFEANTNGAAARTANIYLAGKAIAVNQGYVATSTPGLLEGPAAGADSVTLQFNPPQSVPWTASANDPWLHVPAGNLYAAGNTNFAFTFDANSGPTRTGTLMLGTTPLSITQAGVTYVAAPATLTALVTNGVSAPASVAADNNGYVYITDPGNRTLDEWVLASNSVEPIVYGGLGQPAGVAINNVDGTVAFSDTTSNIVYWWGQGTGNYLSPWVTSGLNGPCGVALDSYDQLYIADSGNNAVKEFTYSLTTLVSGLNDPQGVAVDVFGDVYIADTGNNAIKEWFVANSNVVTVVSNGLNHPASVAVDVSGNIFIADTGDNAIKEWVAASGTLITLVTGLNQPRGIALDSADDLYIADTGNNAVEELPRAFVDRTAVMEPYSAGSDSLPGILPNSVNLLPPFAPLSGQPWLTVTNASSGIVNFAFTANTLTLSPRTAHLNVLGVSVSVTQTNAPVVSAQLTFAQLLANGAFQFTFTNTPGFTFTVLSTTNVALPLTNWVNLGTVTNASPGVYQFTTQPVTNSPQEFYEVVWP